MEAKTKSQGRRRGGVRLPLRYKLTALEIGLVTVPLIAVGYALIDINEDAVEHLSREVQRAVVEDTAREIYSQLGAAEDGLETVGRLLSDEEVPEEASVPAAMAVVEGSAALDHAAIYDARGGLVDVIRERAASGVELPDQLPAEVRDRAEELGHTLGETSAAELAPRVLLVVAIRAELAGPITGFAASRVSMERVAERVERLAEARFPDLPESLVVVDGEGRVLASPEHSAQAPMSIARAPQAWGLEPAAFGVALDRQARLETPSGEVVATARTLPSYRWAILVQVPYAVAFASLVAMRRTVLEVVAAAILLAILAGLFFAREITRPLDRLVAFAKELGERSFGGRIDIESRDELAALGDALSEASVELKESEEKLQAEQAIRGDLRRYLPAEIVDRVVAREQDMRLGGERRQITVLFADVVGFTPLTEERPPEEVVAILNELFTIMTEIIFRHGGMVDKFIGDCVMAVWGAPTEQEDHTERAMAAAEEMLRWLEVGNRSWKERYGIELSLAIGVHRGEAIVGNIGSETRMTYTAIGDVVNVAARLESIARPMQILVTQEVRQVIDEDFECISAGERELAGRRTTVELFEVRS